MVAMKVVITGNTAWNILHFRKPIIDALISEGHEVVALAPADAYVKDLRDAGVRFIPIQMENKGINPVSDLRLIRDFRRIFAKEAPDVILSYTIKNNIYGALAANSLRIPFLPNVSGLGTVFLKKGWLEWVATRLYRRAFRRLKYVMFQNIDDRDLFLKCQIIRPEQSRLVPGSGIDLAHFRPSGVPRVPGAQVTFILIARMLRDKGVVEYVNAARAIKSEFPDCRFQLAGACGVENRTAIGSATIYEWVEEGAVEYLGELSDVRTALLDVDCVVLPSYREGLPRVLLEAGAMGKPIVATDVPGCRDVVDDGVTGILCDVQSVESLYDALKSFLELSDNERFLMGQAGRKKVEDQFGQERVVEIYQKAIRDLVL
tara:strand:+ start:49207 stop:50328 length:1122 start_codon:yes stop_codon:yes gene_type:complete